MIKLFASDLDGTLLNALHMVDAKILSAIREVTESGRGQEIETILVNMVKPRLY